MEPISISEVCNRYALSPDCAISEKPHLIQLSFACANVPYARQDVEGIRPLNWKHIRYHFVKGGWQTGTGHVSRGWSRKYINYQFRRLQKAFQWAAVEELISQKAYRTINLLSPLHAHQLRDARESVPVGVVAWEHVLAISKHVHPRVWDMVQVQWWTGMRTCELVRINTDELDTQFEATKRVWLFRPKKHKTAWRNKPKLIVIGQAAIDILKLYWPTEGIYFFTTKKGTPMARNSYRSAVYLAVDRAKCPAWHPHQLRHSRSSIVDQSLGREACAALLGNTISAAAIYAERNVQLAIEAANIPVQEPA